MADDLDERAELRRAHSRLDRLDQRRDVAHLLGQGADQAVIMRTVDIDRPTLERLTRALAAHPLESHETAEELILHAIVEHADRQLLCEVLGGLAYDAQPSTYRWADVEDGVRDGRLSLAEIESVLVMRSALGRATREGWRTAVSAAETMRQSLADGAETWLLGAVVDAQHDLHRAMATAPDLVPAWRAAPLPVSEHWDSLLAAAIRREFEREGRSSPTWAADRVIED